MTRLVVTHDAEADMASILAYLEHQANAIVAEEIGREIRRGLLRLVQFPDSGAPRPELGTYVRVLVVYPYLLLYEHIPQQLDVVLLRVLHGKASITAEILMRP